MNSSLLNQLRTQENTVHNLSNESFVEIAQTWYREGYVDPFDFNTEFVKTFLSPHRDKLLAWLTALKDVAGLDILEFEPKLSGETSHRDFPFPLPLERHVINRKDTETTLVLEMTPISLKLKIFDQGIGDATDIESNRCVKALSLIDYTTAAEEFGWDFYSHVDLAYLKERSFYSFLSDLRSHYAVNEHFARWLRTSPPLSEVLTSLDPLEENDEPEVVTLGYIPSLSCRIALEELARELSKRENVPFSLPKEGVSPFVNLSPDTTKERPFEFGFFEGSKEFVEEADEKMSFFRWREYEFQWTPPPHLGMEFMVNSAISDEEVEVMFKECLGSIER